MRFGETYCGGGRSANQLIINSPPCVDSGFLLCSSACQYTPSRVSELALSTSEEAREGSLLFGETSDSRDQPAKMPSRPSHAGCHSANP
jgi:hypothetical protein